MKVVSRQHEDGIQIKIISEQYDYIICEIDSKNLPITFPDIIPYKITNAIIKARNALIKT